MPLKSNIHYVRVNWCHECKISLSCSHLVRFLEIRIMKYYWKCSSNSPSPFIMTIKLKVMKINT